VTASNRSTHPVFLRFHGRPWAGAFNVVMATTIVSIAARDVGLELLSIALLWVALAAFVSLAALDLWLARHPVALLRRAGRPGEGFHALGFVADGGVLGIRIVGPGTIQLAIAAGLLACGWVLWVMILGEIAAEHGRRGGTQPRGEWLLAVVATEGLAILGTRIAALEQLSVLHAAAAALWIAGGVAYVFIGALLARRASQPRFGLADVSPDWWIVMGAPAIFCVAAVKVTGAQPGTTGAAVAVVAWAFATLMLIVIAVADVLRTRRLGRRFTPERWTMVFPLGMYSVASWNLGKSLQAAWLTDIGRLWLAVALGAWAAVAFGELRHLLLGD
jgi:tellurite resistance protein TehA-like permease